MVIENTPDNEKRLSESINTAMHHGENVDGAGPRF
jgi:excinuclease ABC subunit A